MKTKYFKHITVVFILLLVSITAYGQLPDNVIGTNIEQDVAKLMALGVLDSKDANEFDPDDMATREDMCVYITRMLNMDEAARTGFYNSAVPLFPDVESNKASIEFMYNIGAVSGYSDGKFYPELNISYNQAIKMIISALNYDSIAGKRGGYPLGYLVVASELKITKNISAIGGELGISKAMLVKLISNCLEAPLIIGKNNNDGEGLIATGQDYTKNILNTYHNITVYQSQIKSSDNSKRRIVADVQNKFDGKNPSYIDDATFVVADGIEVNDLAGLNATLWVNSDRTVIYVELGESFEIIYGYIEAVNGDYEHSSTYDAMYIENILFAKNGGKYKVSEHCNVSFNELPANGTSKGYVNCFAKAVISNGEIADLSVFSLSEGGVVLEIKDRDIFFRKGSVEKNTLENILDQETIVIIDGIPASTDDLRMDMLIDYFYADNGGYAMIVASSTTVKGIIDSLGKDDIQIGDTVYNFDENYSVYLSFNNQAVYGELKPDDATKILGANCEIYLDLKDCVRYVRASGREHNFYGVVMGGEGAGLKKQLKVFSKAINSSGSAEIYDVNLKNSTVSLETAIGNSFNFDGEGVYEFFTNGRNEIIKIEPISWKTANPQIDSVPDGVHHKNKNIFYKAQYITENLLIDSQITAVSNDSVISIRRVRSYNATTKSASYEPSTDIDVLETEFFSLVDSNGDFNPSILNFTDHIMGKYSKTMSLRIEGTDDADSISPKLIVVTNPINEIRNDSKKFGFIQSMALVSEDWYDVTIHYMPDSATRTFTIHKNDMKEDIMYYIQGTEPKEAKRETFVMFIAQGVNSINEDEEEIMLQPNGRAKILKVYDLSRDWDSAAFGINRFMALSDGVIETVTKIEGSALYHVNTDALSGVSQEQFVMYNTNNDMALEPGIDSYAAIEPKALVYEAGQKAGRFFPSSAAAINTSAGISAGDKLFYVVQNKRIRMIVFQRK